MFILVKEVTQHKTDSFSAVEVKVEEMITPRPTIDVDNLESPKSLNRERKKALRSRIPRVSPRAYVVVSRYRDRQRKLLGDESDDDPNPYESSYIFFVNNEKNDDDDRLGR
jgi:hypothetical protein